MSTSPHLTPIIAADCNHAHYYRHHCHLGLLHRISATTAELATLTAKKRQLRLAAPQLAQARARP